MPSLKYSEFPAYSKIYLRNYNGQLIVTADIHQGLYQSAYNILCTKFYAHNVVHRRYLTFWHWSGVTPYTSSCEFAGSCVFDKQLPGIL